jgi:hypothetical protein
MSTHILACHETAQRTKELVADRYLTVTFGKMKTSHYGGWDETEFIKCCSTFVNVARPVLKAISILHSKLKCKVMVTKNVPFEAIDASSTSLSLLVFRGTDDYKGHAVCLMRGLIFDASNKTGVSFDQKNLDLCCGDGVAVEFHSAFRLYTCSRTH